MEFFKKTLEIIELCPQGVKQHQWRARSCLERYRRLVPLERVRKAISPSQHHCRV